ncbi:MAG: hypothetical protein LBH62_08160 [Nitrososphaerota archaeon]|jgi:hypothetical protein|nr:hypothetical protein [Nitrososphaerota archaeon]
MSKEANIQCLQDQIDKVERIIKQAPLTMFVLGAIGGFFLGVLCLFGETGFIIGFIIFGICLSLCGAYARNIKEDYKKLLEQLNQTPSSQK